MSREASRRSLDAELVYAGNYFDVVTVAQQDNEPLEFVLAEDSVRVYPVDANGILWLIREKRPGFGDRLFLRAVSGTIERGETAAHAARREAREELGVRGGDLVRVHTSTANLKVLNSIYHYVMQGWRSGPSEPEGDENICPYPVKLSDVPELVWSGEVAEDTVSLTLLKIHRFFASRFS